MPTVTISLPGLMKDWIEAQAGNGRFSGVSDYMRDLIRRDQIRNDQREALVQALIEGEESAPTREWTPEELKSEARRRAGLKNGG